MYAVIEDRGAQYKASEGSIIEIDACDAQSGDAIEFDRVLLLSTDDGATVGTPFVDSARVVAEVVDDVKGKKLTVLRFHRRKRLRVKRGHRQRYTRVRIKEIVLPQGAGVAAGAGQTPATAEAEKEGKSDGA